MDNQKQKKIRILLVDDHSVLRSGLRLLINSQRDMLVVAEASDGTEAVQMYPQIAPDVVVMDLSMPKMRGLEAAEQIIATDPKARLVAFTQYEDEAFVRSFLHAGGQGYVLKRAVDHEIVNAVRTVNRGRMFVDPHLSGSILYELLANAHSRSARKSLSERERQVLLSVAQGFTNQEIATRIGVSVKTVETYRSRLGEKLGLHTRPEVVRYALEIGLLRPEAFDV